jgi:glycosyltransferase involved in cell wall biosynthesis
MSEQATHTVVAITSVIKNRAWCLPAFLASLRNLTYPAEQLRLIFIDDASSDETPTILKSFRAKYGKAFASVEIIRKEAALDDATSARNTIDRKAGYPHLAALRNEIMELAVASGADYQFSIDSDILVSPGIIEGLMAHGKPYVSSIIFNDVEAGVGRIALNCSLQNRVTNAGGLFNNTWKIMRTTGNTFNKLIPCGYSGAVFLIDRATMTSGAQFGVNPFGAQACEDYGFCWGLQERNIDRHIDTTLRAVHIMLPRNLNEAIGVYYAWFGCLPGGRKV